MRYYSILVVTNHYYYDAFDIIKTIIILKKSFYTSKIVKNNF